MLTIETDSELLWIELWMLLASQVALLYAHCDGCGE